MKIRRKAKKRPISGLAYVAGAADDGYGFFPTITCQVLGKDAVRVRWVVHRQRGQLPDKQAALEAADAEIALAFGDHPSLPSSPDRFLDYLLQRGFSELTSYREAKSFDEDRRSALGAEYQPPIGEAAARNDPVLHAALLEMVNQQIADNDPPETRETVERLLEAGYSPEYIRRMIGFLIAREFTQSVFRRTEFDMQRYIETLRRLPEIPPP